MVGYHVPGGERPVEAQSVEPGEPAERHVRLAGGEQGAGPSSIRAWRNVLPWLLWMVTAHAGVTFSPAL